MKNKEIPANLRKMVLVLDRLRDQTVQDLRYFNLYRRGLKTLKEKFDDNTVIKLDQSDSEQISKELLSNEIKQMYPNYLRKSIISLFSSLEATVKDCIKTFLIETDDLSNIEKISKIKISLHEYEQMNSVEKYDYIFEMFEREVCKGVSYGPKRFEALFTNIGFTKKTKFSNDRDLMELAQVRNCLIHNGGIVDRSFAAKCGWKKSIIGEPLEIDVLDYIRYNMQASNYVEYLIDMIRNT